MKVLQINTVAGIKSTGRIASDLSDVIKAEGGECIIAYGREEVPSKYQGIVKKINSDLGVKIDALKTMLFDNATFNSYFATKKFCKWIAEYNPDIVHIHNLHGYYINSKVLFKFLKKINKPVVWTLHDCWAFTGHCSHFNQIGCKKWMTGCHSCSKKKAYPKSILFDNSKRNWEEKKEIFTMLDKVVLVTPSYWLKGLAESSYLGKYPCHAIPSGIDLEIFKPRPNPEIRKKYNLENKKIVLGAATAWSDNKGINEFIELANVLGDEYKIVLLGMKEAEIKKLPDNVLGLPRTKTMEELAEFYTEADVFVNLGKQETMGLTTVEAMATGTKVVVSNKTAVPEVVKGGGLIVDEYSVEDFAKKIKEAIDKDFDTIENAKMYEKKGQFLKYIEIYKSLLE